jgi:hypothetical protein
MQISLIGYKSNAPNRDCALTGFKHVEENKVLPPVCVVTLVTRGLFNDHFFSSLR